MRRLIVAATLVLLLWIGATAVSQQPRPLPTSSILGLLKKGQPIAVKDAGFAYELTVYVEGPEKLGHTIIDVTADYVVVRDLTGITDLAIPVWSIKSVATVRLRTK